jgi:uncharacterized membrane protein HdeD (DUF308 family)
MAWCLVKCQSELKKPAVKKQIKGELLMGAAKKSASQTFRRIWWILLLRGVLALAFGLVSWFQPHITISVLMLYFGVYVLLDGLLSVWGGITDIKGNKYWWVLLIWGLVGIVVGVMALSSPATTLLMLLRYMAIWAIVTGALEIISVIRPAADEKREWVLVLGGLVSIVFGVILLAQPVSSLAVILGIVAAYATMFGIILIILGFMARAKSKKLASSS